MTARRCRTAVTVVHITGDAEADALLSSDPFALLVGMLLDLHLPGNELVHLDQPIEALPGFGRQKAKILTALVAKQLGCRPDGWKKAAGDYALEGYRSVADVAVAASLAKVRAHKQEQKAAARDQA